ncbi:helicase, partial [Coemansia sp. RSA 2708]
ALMALDRPLFATAPDARDAARAVRLQCVPSARAQSDWLADLRAFERYAGGERLECVSAVAVREAKDSVKTLRRCVRDLGLDGSADVSLDGDEELRVLKAVVLAGLSPQLARVRMPRQKYHEVASGTISVDPEARELAFYAVDEAGSEPATWQAHDVRGDRRVFVHPQSTLFAEASYAAPFVAYLAQWAGAAGNKTFMRDVTVPGIYAVLLFGPAVVVDHEHKVLAIGRSGALAVRAWPRIGVLVGQLRRLLDELLRRKLADPQLDIRDHPRYWWTPIAELDFNEHSAASISLTSSLLGAVIGFGLCALCVSGWSAFGVLCVYFALVSVYHMLEYLSVCLYNPERLEMGSFMFNPDVGNGYMTAMAVSLAEYLAGWLYCGGRAPGWLTCVGLLMALAGQALRTLAMVTAGTSFNHYVATKRAADHELVTCGVYAVERHPSYVGFFLWAVGLQLMLSNLVSAGLFAA